MAAHLHEAEIFKIEAFIVTAGSDQVGAHQCLIVADHAPPRLGDFIPFSVQRAAPGQ